MVYYMAMNLNESLSGLIKRLVSAGFTKKEIVKDGIGYNWTKAELADENIQYEIKLNIARNLGLDIKEVLDPDVNINMI